MRVVIHAESQEEFDSKRESLIKALAGKKLGIEISQRVRSRYDDEKSPNLPRKPYYRAQKEMLEYWDGRFKEMLSEIKREINEALK